MKKTIVILFSLLIIGCSKNAPELMKLAQSNLDQNEEDSAIKNLDLLISKFPSYSFKKIVIPRRTTIFLLFGIVLFFGLLLIYTFNVIAISAVVYVLLLPISFFHFQKIKKRHENDKIQEDDDLEDVL